MNGNHKLQEDKNTYEEEYLEWKAWGDKFGKITANQRKYFDNELRNIELKKEGEINVLEIGFGNGEFLEYCRNKGWKIEGLEVNYKLIQKACYEGYIAKESKYINEYEENYFDIIAAFDVLEHLDEGETLEILNSINRILKENGVFIARFPNGDSPFGLKNQNGDVTHKQSIGMGKIQYYSNVTQFEVLYLGKPAHVVWCKSLKKLIYGLIILPVIKFLNIIVVYGFYQGARINFFSENLVAILRPRENNVQKNKNR